MIIIRLLLIIAVLVIALSGVMYLFTRNRRYLKLAGQIAQFVIVAVLLFALLIIVERYVLVAWRTIF
jgi:hypothetical protein